MIWLELHRVLAAGNAAVLAVVVESLGSAPGKQGFKMVVCADGRLVGTIGGGVMEAGIIRRSQKLLSTKSRLGRLVPQIHHDRAPQEHKSGMICAGRQTILLQPLYSDDEPTIQAILETQTAQAPAILRFKPDKLSLEPVVKGEPVMRFHQEQQTWSYAEMVGATDTLYIVGGGHVGLAISRIFQHLGFRIIIFDHRHNLETLAQNNIADEMVIGPYGALADHVRPGTRSYVAVVSAAFTSDVEALSCLIPLDLRYVGLMGSQAKIKRIFSELKKQGYSQEKLSHIHAPMGLPIANKTPAEIAISLAAEIISIRNKPTT